MPPAAPEATGAIGRPAWMGVDLDALAGNLERLRAHVEPAGVLAVVKADAYGHGATAVARRLEGAGVEALGVAFAAEGVALRNGGVSVPIVVLGPTHRDEPSVYRRHRLTPTISDLARLDVWAAWGAVHNVLQPLHLKVDTGMSRLGLSPDELPAALTRIRESKHLELAGIMSHLAEADEPSSAANARQSELFAELLYLLTEDERGRATVHLANSAGALYLEGARHQLVRAGLALYGVDPARSESPPVVLEPVMSVGASIVSIRPVKAGTAAGYGGTWTAQRPSRLALIPIGYGDGYPWRLSNRGEVLIGGQRAPIAGRVSMDMLVADVTDLDTRVGAPVVLLGAQGDDRIDAWELADRAGSTAWEILCQLGLRLPRLYRGS